MKIFFITLLCITPFLAQANVCEVPKSAININGLSLGRSITHIQKEHPNTFDFDLKGDKAGIGLVDQGDFEDRFHGTPATTAGYISFDKKTKLVTGFSVGFDHLNEFSAGKYKNGLIALYALPRKNWKYSKSSDGYQEFSYTCDDYSIEINHSEEQNSFMIIESH